jgi:hypothetical protein
VVAADLHALGLAAPATSTGEVLQLVTGDVDSYLHTAAILGGPPGPCERLSLEALAAASA